MDGLYIICFFTSITLNMGTLVGYRIQEDENVQTVLAAYGEKIQYTITSLQRGTPECFLEVDAVEKNAGLSLCRLIPQDSTRVIEKLVYVRVVGRLAPLRHHVLVSSGDDAVLTCVTTEGRIPLDHCYFTSPMGEIISINRRMLNLAARYSYPINTSMDRGDCAVTVHNVSYRDSGTWGCSGRLEREYLEQRATIRLDVEDEEIYNENQKIIVYAYIAVLLTLVLTVFAFLIIVWKKSRII